MEEFLFVKLQAKASNLTKSNTFPWVFFKFLSCTNSAKSHKTSHIEITDD